MKRVLVTAINSLLDHKLVEYLISENYLVRIISPDIGLGNVLLKLPVEIFNGDLSDPVAVRRSAKGCHYLIQTAPASLSINGVQNQVLHLQETMALFDAAAQANVETFLQIRWYSSLCTNGSPIAGTVKNCPVQPASPPVPACETGNRQLYPKYWTNCKIIRVQVDHVPIKNGVVNMEMARLDDAVTEIHRLLIQGENGWTYIIGKQAVPTFTLQQRILRVLTTPLEIITYACFYIKTAVKRRLLHSGWLERIKMMFQILFIENVAQQHETSILSFSSQQLIDVLLHTNDIVDFLQVMYF